MAKKYFSAALSQLSYQAAQNPLLEILREI
jgi:hypothetical protein